MKMTVMNIKSETEIEEELSSQYNVQLGQEEKPTRSKIMRLGDRLVDTTQDVLQGVKKLLSQLNKNMEFVQVGVFVFEEADYKFVSLKEVNEVREIFKAFDIYIKELNVNGV